jgi:hypothetical protein
VRWWAVRIFVIIFFNLILLLLIKRLARKDQHETTNPVVLGLTFRKMVMDLYECGRFLRLTCLVAMGLYECDRLSLDFVA